MNLLTKVSSLSAVGTFIILATPTLASEPDFYFMFDKCKSILGAMNREDNTPIVIEGDPYNLGCKRTGSRVLCSFSSGSSGETAKRLEYKVVMDMPPKLSLNRNEGADFIEVDTVRHTAASTTRIMSEVAPGLGTKLCTGTFATAQEMELLGRATETAEETKGASPWKMLKMVTGGELWYRLLRQDGRIIRFGFALRNRGVESNPGQIDLDCEERTVKDARIIGSKWRPIDPESFPNDLANQACPSRR